MGDLSRIPLAELVREHALDTVVETGTGHGFSIEAATRVASITGIHSIEIDTETYLRERKRFEGKKHVRIYLGNSVTQIPLITMFLQPRNARVLWFLDAHFPGSGRNVPAPMMVTPIAVPIVHEVRALLWHRDLSRDVIVVDDLCLFEAGDYETDAPHFREALGPGLLAELERAVLETHTITRLTKDGGYLIARPKCDT